MANYLPINNIKIGLLNALPTLNISNTDQKFIKRNIHMGTMIDPNFFNFRYALPHPFIGLLHQYNTLVNQTSSFATPLGTIITQETDDEDSPLDKCNKKIKDLEKQIDDLKKNKAASTITGLVSRTSNKNLLEKIEKLEKELQDAKNEKNIIETELRDKLKDCELNVNNLLEKNNENKTNFDEQIKNIQA